MHVAFVLLHWIDAAICESGQTDAMTSLRWSINRKGRLCSAMKANNLISASFTFFATSVDSEVIVGITCSIVQINGSFKAFIFVVCRLDLP